MSDAAQPFSFGQFVPGFDFLKNLASGSAAQGRSAAPVSAMASWVAPTLSEEEVDKRIKELKVVQFWLEQNLNALKATVQALEVQKMTLGTLKGMNLRMEDLANAFTNLATVPKVPAAAASATQQAPAAEPEARTEAKASSSAAGVVDPMQWWNALTEQFQGIANTAMQEAANLKMPGMPGAAKPAAAAKGKAPAVASKTTATARKHAKPARKRASPTNKG